MALTPADSAEYLQALVTEPKSRVSTPDWGGRLEVSKGSLVFTVAGTGTGRMVRLPAGRLIIFPDLCRVVCPVGTATADLHVGRGAYTNMAGAIVAASDNAYADNLDVGGGAIDQAWVTPALGYDVIESKFGVDITIMIDTANSPAAGEAQVTVVYGRAK